MTLPPGRVEPPDRYDKEDVRGPSWNRYVKGPPFGWLKVAVRGVLIGGALSAVLVPVGVLQDFPDLVEAAWFLTMGGAAVGLFFGLAQIVTANLLWWSINRRIYQPMPALPDDMYSWGRISVVVGIACTTVFSAVSVAYSAAGRGLPS